MSNLPVVTEAVLLHCGQCEDFDAPLIVNGVDATCAACGDVKSIALDIVRHLDRNEVAVVTREGHLGYVDMDALED